MSISSKRARRWALPSILATFALVSGLCAVPLVGCAPEESSSGGGVATVETDEMIQVTVTLDFNSIEEGERTEDVSIHPGATVLEALEETGFIIDVQDSSYGPYVVAIDGVAAGDHGDQSGWLVAVNGEDLMVSAGEYTISDGDVITWTYVTTFE